MSADADDELVDEQMDFYRADATAFDDWLVTLLDARNGEPVARNYRAGRQRVAQLGCTTSPTHASPPSGRRWRLCSHGEVE